MPKSTLKLITFVIAAVALVFVLLVSLAFVPSVQTWLVRKALAESPGTEVVIGRVVAGLTSAQLSDVRLAQDGMEVRMARASVRYSAREFLFSRRINLETVSVEGLELDLRNARAPGATTPAPTGTTGPVAPAQRAPQGTGDAAGARAFNGLLQDAALPFDLRVGRAEVQGRAMLPDEQTVVFNLGARGIEAGGEGHITWSIEFLDASSEAAVQAVLSEGEATVGVGADGQVNDVSLVSHASGRGPGLPPDRLRMEARMARAGEGREDYTGRVLLLRDGQSETLVQGRATFDGVASSLAGDWEVALAQESLGALLAGFNLPELAVSGTGSFVADLAAGAVTTAGEVQGQLARLEALAPALETIGAVRFQTRFDARSDADQLRVERFDLGVTTEAGAELARVQTLQPVSFRFEDQGLTFADPAAELARVDVQRVPLAWAQPFIGAATLAGGDVSLTLVLEGTADGSRVRGRSVEPLAVRALTVREGERTWVEDATISLYPDFDYADGRLQVALRSLEVAVPAGDTLSGEMEAEIGDLFGQPQTAFTAGVKARLVSALQPHLPLDPGLLTADVALAGTVDAARFRLSRLDATISRDAGALLAAVVLRQPVQLELESMQLAGENPEAVLGVRLGTIPLEWANAFVDAATVSGEVTGGELDLAARMTGGFTVKTTAPLTLRGAGLLLDDKEWVQALDASVDFSARREDEVISYEVRRLTAVQQETVLAAVSATGEARLGDDTVRLTAKGNFEGDVASLARQPGLAPYATLARGKLAATFEARLDETMEVKSAVSARGLVAKAGNKELGDVELKVALATKPDGTGTVTMPLTVVVGGRRSDLTIAGGFVQGEKGFAFDGQLTGNELTVDDLQAFAVLAPETAPESAPARPGGAPATAPRAGSPAPPARDSEPFWGGVSGRFATDFKKVNYGTDYVLTDVRGRAVLTESRLALETFEGRNRENPFKVSGELTFTAAQPRPYRLTGALDATKVDLGAILRAANPQERPAVETQVSVNGRISGSGGTLDDLLVNVQGQFDVTGEPGVLRALGRRGETVGRVSAVVGLIGAIQGSATTVATSELAAQLNEMRFDSLKMKVERGEDLSLKLTSLEFLSPTGRVTGTGTITHREGVPITKQPLRLQLSLAGKGALAQVLNRTGLLDGKQDEREYYTMTRNFSISGTPLSPDSSELWRLVTEAAIRAAIAPRGGATQGEGQTQPAGPGR